MRLEVVPVVVGIVVGLTGLILVLDAWIPDNTFVRRERRRRRRGQRHRGGEAAIGIGFLCMAAAFVGRDRWSYSVVAVIAGTLCVAYGILRNRRYLASAVWRRGESRSHDTSPR
jgi:hypothetical protein